MSKFNIATEYFESMYRSMERVMDAGGHDGNGIALLFGMKKGMTDFVAGKMRLLNPEKYSIS